MTSTGKTVLIIGASSAIGRAAALEYAAAGWHVMLAGRSRAQATRTGDDLAVRLGAQVSIHALDILDLPRLPTFVQSLPALPDTVVCVVGMLGEQERAARDAEYAAHILRTNFEGPALVLGLFCDAFLARNSGTIVGVSSVAGDRGRGSNYVYGSAKAGLTAYLSGLRSRAARSGVRVVTVKPGFVRTRMTAGLELPGLLAAAPEEVGRAIFMHADGGRWGEVVYVRPIWRAIMALICALPEELFKRLTF